MLLLLLLAACGQNDSEAVTSEEDIIPEIITAELTVPKEISTEEKNKFQVTVKQGNQPVSEVDEVQFEFWQTDAKENNEKVEAVPQGDGVYTVEKSFTASGEYHVQSHVTANSMHVMPKKTFTVSGDKETPAEDHAEEHATSEQHNHHSDLTAETQFASSPITGTETDLDITVNQDGETLQGASVTLEITESENEDPVWVNLEETEPGLYQGKLSFSESGAIPVNIHIKKDELHDHIEKQIEVAE